MDTRLKHLAEQLDAGLIARREFLRKAAIVTGGTAAGLHALRSMAPAQAKTKLRLWLFKSFVTAGNDVVAKQIETWAKDKNVEVEMDWATFGDREQKFVAAIGGDDLVGNEPMNARGDKPKCHGQRVRIALEHDGQNMGETRHDPRAGRKRILVRVELYRVAIGLEARLVTLDPADVRALVHQRPPSLEER